MRLKQRRRRTPLWAAKHAYVEFAEQVLYDEDMALDLAGIKRSQYSERELTAFRHHLRKVARRVYRFLFQAK